MYLIGIETMKIKKKRPRNAHLEIIWIKKLLFRNNVLGLETWLELGRRAKSQKLRLCKIFMRDFVVQKFST